MYKSIKRFLDIPLKGKILAIGRINNFKSVININKEAELVETRYPDVDMRDLPYPDNIFDFVISDQVIEHVEDPKKAIEESYRVLKKEGIAIHTSCFINYIHPRPVDFWRFTPDALRYLCKDFSKIIYCGGWGTRVAVFLCFVSQWFRIMPIPENRFSIRRLIATSNERRYPIVVWIIAKK